MIESLKLWLRNIPEDWIEDKGGHTVERVQQGAPLNNPRDQQGAPLNNPRDQEGAPLNNPRDQQGAPLTNPRDQHGAPLNNPRDQQSTRLDNPRDQQGTRLDNPRDQQGTPINRQMNTRQEEPDTQELDIDPREQVLRLHRDLEKTRDKLQGKQKLSHIIISYIHRGFKFFFQLFCWCGRYIL